MGYLIVSSFSDCVLTEQINKSFGQKHRLSRVAIMFLIMFMAATKTILVYKHALTELQALRLRKN